VCPPLLVGHVFITGGARQNCRVWNSAACRLIGRVNLFASARLIGKRPGRWGRFLLAKEGTSLRGVETLDSVHMQICPVCDSRNHFARIYSLVRKRFMNGCWH